MPYWVDNKDKWDELSLNSYRGDCDGIPQSALDTAISGCVVGAIAGAAGTPVGSLSACIVGGVLAATGATLWGAIKCAAYAIAESISQ